jgi:hypothetical protein
MSGRDGWASKKRERGVNNEGSEESLTEGSTGQMNTGDERKGKERNIKEVYTHKHANQYPRASLTPSRYPETRKRQGSPDCYLLHGF